MDGQGCLEFDNVVVVSNTGLLLVCRVNGQAVSVLPQEMLFGTTIWQPGDDGRLVLPRQVALKLGLALRERAG